jgi:hypothetical protein
LRADAPPRREVPAFACRFGCFALGFAPVVRRLVAIPGS